MRPKDAITRGLAAVGFVAFTGGAVISCDAQPVIPGDTTPSHSQTIRRPSYPTPSAGSDKAGGFCCNPASSTPTPGKR